jgi:YggT family protein
MSTGPTFTNRRPRRTVSDHRRLSSVVVAAILALFRISTTMRTYCSPMLFYLLVFCSGSSNAFAPSSRPACIQSHASTAGSTNAYAYHLQSSTTASTHLKTRNLQHTSSSSLQMIDPSLTGISTSLILAETEAWVQPTAVALDIFTNFLSLAMLIRVVLSWYPTMNVKELPWSLVVLPTEPLLKAVRGSIPPAFGVDITPIVWLGFFTFVHEILLGQQGLLTMKMKYGI